jgi:hypothetical protein
MRPHPAFALLTAGLAACASVTLAPASAPASPAAAPAAGSATHAASNASAEGGEGSNEPLSISSSKAHTEGKHYALDAKAPSSVKLGTSGEIEILLEAKDGYHTNDKYPFRLVPVADPETLLAFEKKELSRGDGSISKAEAKFKVKFAALKSGTAKVGGLLAFSVCTAKECVVDKVELTVPVTIR